MVTAFIICLMVIGLTIFIFWPTKKPEPPPIVDTTPKKITVTKILMISGDIITHKPSRWDNCYLDVKVDHGSLILVEHFWNVHCSWNVPRWGYAPGEWRNWWKEDESYEV